MGPGLGDFWDDGITRRVEYLDLKEIREITHLISVKVTYFASPLIVTAKPLMNN